MNIATIISKAYAVTTASGCTVTTASGITILTVPANTQACFIAPTADVIISDDSAIITPLS